MTLARRIAAVEATLSPAQLIMRWLDEAHAFGDLESYVRSLLDVAPDAPRSGNRGRRRVLRAAGLHRS
jgi:hypothetical protein